MSPTVRFPIRKLVRAEDGKYDGVSGPPLRARTAHQERCANGHGRQGVADVVDEVGQQRNGVRDCEEETLHAGCNGQDSEADQDGADAGSRTEDRAVDEAVRVPVLGAGQR